METILTIINEGEEFKFPVKLNKAQIRRLYDAANSDKQAHGWEMPEVDSTYYYEDAAGKIKSASVSESENSLHQVQSLYSVGNCYSSESLAKDIARSNMLIRKLHRFAIEHRTNPISEKKGGYTIMYNYVNKCIEVGLSGTYLSLGDVLFESEDNAREAITENRDELIWYFTEFKDRL